MLTENTIKAIDNLVQNLSKEDCEKVYDNNNSCIARYRQKGERQGQYYHNIIFDKVNAPLPELFYEKDDKLSEEIYTNVLFKIINKLENE